MYTPEAMEHFLSPRNAGVVAAADGRGEATNHACGDTVVMTVAVAAGTVTAVRFSSQACAGGIASCSAATEWATGKAVSDVAGLQASAISELLGGLPDAKLGCAEMAAAALRRAVAGGAVEGGAGEGGA